VGGQADIFVQPSSIHELRAIRKYLSKNSLPSVVIGSTSNLLFSDEGLRVPCIQIGPRLSRIVVQDCTVRAEAGA
jgi:UDP-N-acetylmuramate dehydrogenase